MNQQILKRPSLEEYYMSIAFTVSLRTTCINRAVGCVIVTKDNRSILSTGYNGTPLGLPHCSVCRRREEGYKSGEGLHRCRSSHGEQNALVQAAKYGKEVNNAILYCTDLPCNECAKMIINAGISKIVYCNDYPNSEAKEMFNKASIEIVKLDKDEIIKKLKKRIDLMSITHDPKGS